jgi:hypothetical protein
MRDERGTTLVIVSLALVAMLGTAGLAVDGGRILSSRRQAQNASDAAAVAGADALFAYQYAAATNQARDPSTINQAVLDKLNQNSANTAPTCQLVSVQSGTISVIGSCNGASDVQLIAASGVQASGTLQQSAAFTQLVGISKYSAAAKATATVQPLVSTGAPFILCGAAQNGWNILNPDDSINIPAAQQLINIPLQRSNVPDCGAGNSKFDGLGADNGPIGIGQWEDVTNGNRYSSTVDNAVAGQTPCPADPTQIPNSGCAILVPIADNARGTSTVQMHVVAFGIFLVAPVTSSGGGLAGTKFVGTFLAPANLALLGQGAFGVHCAAGTQVCTVKLAQ